MHQHSAVSLSENKRMAATSRSCVSELGHCHGGGARIVTLGLGHLNLTISPRPLQRPLQVEMAPCNSCHAGKERRIPSGESG